MIEKIVVVITGASGVELGKKFIDYLPKEIAVELVTTQSAITVEALEHHKVTLHNNKNIGASIASGSFRVDAVVVIPCSMNTLAKIAVGISDNLATRVASVAIKEHTPLLLAPREMPFSAIALEQMHKLATLGIIIAPPVMAYYAQSQTLEEMERFIIGKWYDLLGIEHTLYRRWGSKS
jgi:4-hydroxy-3-polyprenylbenzoate decarboxylase